MLSLSSFPSQAVVLTEIERRQNPFVEQNDRGAEADPCPGGLLVMAWRD